MSPERLYVLDNNVLISAFLFRHSTPRKVFDRALELGRVLHSNETLEELWEVLVRPKFDRYLSLYDRITLLQGFEQVSQPVLISEHVTLCRDPKDDKFLSLALAVQTECIITGDKDLLALFGTFPVPILTPTQFWDKEK
jgi:hypothetical protein